MTNSVENEEREQREMQERMVAVCRLMLESKRQLQQEIRDDMKDPEIRAAIDELRKRNAERASERV